MRPRFAAGSPSSGYGWVDEPFLPSLKRWPRLQLKTDHLPEKSRQYQSFGFQKSPDRPSSAAAVPPDALRKFLESFCGPG